MVIYGTPEQCKKFPGIYEKFPEKEYYTEIIKRIQTIKIRKFLEQILKETN